MVTRNWYFLPTPEAWRAPCAARVTANNCSQPPAWDQPSFRRIRRLEAKTLAGYTVEHPKFTPLELGACAVDLGLPREPGGSAEWRQMFLGPGLNKPATCWGCPYSDECIAVSSCNAIAGSAIGV